MNEHDIKAREDRLKKVRRKLLVLTSFVQAMILAVVVLAVLHMHFSEDQEGYVTGALIIVAGFLFAWVQWTVRIIRWRADVNSMLRTLGRGMKAMHNHAMEREEAAEGGNPVNTVAPVKKVGPLGGKSSSDFTKRGNSDAQEAEKRRVSDISVGDECEIPTLVGAEKVRYYRYSVIARVLASAYCQAPLKKGDVAALTMHEESTVECFLVQCLSDPKITPEPVVVPQYDCWPVGESDNGG